MPGYIPDSDAEKINWLANFTTWLVPNGPTHGISTTEVNDMVVLAGTANVAFGNNVTQQALAKASTAAKNHDLGAAIAKARDIGQRVQLAPNTTDADRAAAGLNVPDLGHTATALDAITALQSPQILLDFSIRHQVTIHWGPNPGNEHQNAKPHGVFGCEIQYAKGAIPQVETGWISLGLDSESPMQHHVTDTTPTTYIYRARYVDKKLNYGNFGDPAECTVSV